MIPTQKMHIYKNSLNFSVSNCFLYTVSADIAHRGKALKTQFKEMSFLNITFSLGHSQVFLCYCIRSIDFKIQGRATILGMETRHSQNQTRPTDHKHGILASNANYFPAKLKLKSSGKCFY